MLLAMIVGFFRCGRRQVANLIVEEGRTCIIFNQFSLDLPHQLFARMGRLTARSIPRASMLAGLSKWPILRVPPCFCADAVSIDAINSARCGEHAQISLHGPCLLFVTRAEKTRHRLLPALLGLRTGGAITYRIRGTGARYRRCFRLAASCHWSSQRS